MRLKSTRNNTEEISFREAVRNCIPTDGGLYVPAGEESLRPWILYMDESTSFRSIAGTLTAALLQEELSPVISERLACEAFTFTPELHQVSDDLSLLNLYTGPSGSYKDFGISFLTSYLEHVLTMEDSTATVLAATSGELGVSLASAFKGKKNVKAVLLYPEGKVLGLPTESLWQNGGNLYPVAVNASIEDCYKLVREVCYDRELVKKYHVTLANTMNFCRLLPQTFFYMYAFSRLKKRIHGDIFYALTAGNYGNLVAGLYAWKFALPVNGFITDNTVALARDPSGYCICPDSIVPLDKRDLNDPATPSNFERLEHIFNVQSSLMRTLVFPEDADNSQTEQVIRDFYKDHGIFLDKKTARAYQAFDSIRDSISEGGGHTVLLQQEDPSLYAADLRRIIGTAPKISQGILQRSEPVSGCSIIPLEKQSIIDIMSKISDC